MSYILYIPIPFKDTSAKFRDLIKHWVKAEKENENEIIVTYYGQKGLTNIPSFSKIYVAMHGIDQRATPFAKNIPLELAMQFKSLSTHLQISDEKNAISVMTAAKRMIKDGLYNSQTEWLRIKLFFCDAVDKAHSLALAFTEQLKQDKRYLETNLRIDYYQNRILIGPFKKTDAVKAHKYGVEIRASQEDHLIHRASEFRYSFFSKKPLDYKLTTERIRQAIQAYQDYKSSRWFGLSGLLGLNNFFSSNISAATIFALQEARDDHDYFRLAANYVERNAENELAKHLAPYVKTSRDENNNKWAGKSNLVI